MERYFKLFFSKYEECQWLNRMGVKGYYLEKISFHYYYFTRNKNCVYSYSIEHLDCPKKSETAIELFSRRKKIGEDHLFRKGAWDYFCAAGKKINMNADGRKKISNLYFWRTIYLFFFSLVGTLLAGYQKFALIFLDTFQHPGDGQFDMLAMKNNSFDIVRGIWNGLLTLLNNTYFKLFRNWFGENSVALVMAFVIPITIVLITYFALNLNEYIFWKYIKNGRLTVSGRKK